MQSRKTTRQFSQAAVLAMLVTGCASQPDIRSDYDADANFAAFSTYNFIDDVGPHASRYQDLFTKYMIAAVSSEMEKRGYTRSDNPDLLVDFNIHLEERTQVTTTSVPVATGYYGYRGGYYHPWGGYGYATETHVSEYTEGTFNIDIVDRRRMQLVWEAVGIGRVSQKKLKNLEAAVKQGVPQYFAKYPFLAGSANPVGNN